MKIEFETIRIKNFMSVGNDPIEIFLNRSKSTLVSATNGSGKSVVMIDSITFALYGKPYRKINKPQLVNSINQKGCMVEVEFKRGKDKFKIERGIKPNVFNIYKNDTLINQDSKAKDYQAYLEKNILGMNFKAFTQIVILSSSSFVPFMQLSPYERRNIIENILDISIFSKMNLILKERYKALKEKRKEINHEFDLKKQSLTLKKNHVEELNNNNKEKIELNNKKITKEERSLFELEEQIEELDKKILDLVETVLDTESYDVLEKKIDKSKKAKFKCKHIISENKDKIDFFEDNDTCPTCTQTIDPSFKKEKIQQYIDKNQELSEKLEEVQALNESLVSKKEKDEDLKDQIRRLKSSKKVLTSNKQTVEKNIKNLKEENEGFKSSDKENLQSHLKEIKELREEYMFLIKEKEETFNKLELFAVGLELLEDSGIKTKIIKQYIPVINKQINNYLKTMDFSVSFHLDETFSETIKSSYRDKFSYESFSEGEKARIDLALMFTWREISRLRNSASTNLLILDEVFDGSLDSDARDSLLLILDTLKNTNVFVISHFGDALYDKFRSFIKISKENNFTKITK